MKTIKAGKRLKFKRRMMKKTDYKMRLALLKSGMPRLVVRKAHNNIRLQFVRYEPSGDRTEVEVLSKEIRKLGWKFSCGNVPAAYLAGLLAGARARQKGIKSAVLDTGLQAVSKGSALFAAAQGVRDGGVDVPMGEGIVDAKRIRGEHIAAYSKLTKGTAAFNRQFGLALKAGAEPERMPQIVDEIKGKILSEYKQGGGSP